MSGLIYHVNEISRNQRPSPPKFIHKRHTKPFTKQPNNVIDRLVFQRIRPHNADLLVDRHAIVLNGRHARHLDRSLQGTRDEEPSEGRSVGEEFQVGLCLVLMLVGDAFLDLVEFCSYPRVLCIAVGMEAS